MDENKFADYDRLPCSQVGCGDLWRYVADIGPERDWFSYHLRHCPHCHRIANLLAWLRYLRGRPASPMPPRQGDCPLLTTLKQFYHRDRLTEDNTKCIKLHLQVCASCRNMLDLIRFDDVHPHKEDWQGNEELLQHPREGNSQWKGYSCVSPSKIHAFLANELSDKSDLAEVRSHSFYSLTGCCSACASQLNLLAWLRHLRKKPIHIGDCEDGRCVPDALLRQYSGPHIPGGWRFNYLRRHLKDCPECSRCLELIRYEKNHPDELIWPVWEKSVRSSVGNNYPRQQADILRWSRELLEEAATHQMLDDGLARNWLQNRLMQPVLPQKTFGDLPLQELLQKGREDVVWKMVKDLESGVIP